MSLCFDGGTGAYEDKLMNKHHVGPFDLMFNIQFAKMLLAGLGLVVTGQITGFFVVRTCVDSIALIPCKDTPDPPGIICFRSKVASTSATSASASLPVPMSLSAVSVGLPGLDFVGLPFC